MFEFYWDSPVLDDDRDDQELDEAEEDEAGAQQGEDVDGLEFKFEFRCKKLYVCGKLTHFQVWDRRERLRADNVLREDGEQRGDSEHNALSDVLRLHPEAEPVNRTKDKNTSISQSIFFNKNKLLGKV